MTLAQRNKVASKAAGDYLAGDDTLSVVSRRHGVSLTQLFTWVDRMRRGDLPLVRPPTSGAKPKGPPCDGCGAVFARRRAGSRYCTGCCATITAERAAELEATSEARAEHRRIYLRDWRRARDAAIRDRRDEVRRKNPRGCAGCGRRLGLKTRARHCQGCLKSKLTWWRQPEEQRASNLPCYVCGVLREGAIGRDGCSYCSRRCRHTMNQWRTGNGRHQPKGLSESTARVMAALQMLQRFIQQKTRGLQR